MTSAAIIRRIAEETGISPHTVRRILIKGVHDTRPTYVSRGQKILALAKELNYKPNAAAKAIRTGRFNNIGLLLGMDKFRSNISQSLMDGIHNILGKKHLRLMEARLAENELTGEESVPTILREWTCDGMLVNYHSAVPARLSTILDEMNLQTVWINTDKPTDCVRPDDEFGAQALTQAFISEGFKKIAYIDFQWFCSLKMGVRHYSKIHRLRGYEKAMEEAGLPSLFVNDGNVVENLKGKCRKLRSLFEGRQRPEAVICYSNEWIEASCAASSLGLALHKDIMSGTFCSESELEFTWQQRSAIVPERAMGELAVEMLLKKIEKPIEKPPAVKVPFTIVEPERRIF